MQPTFNPWLGYFDLIDFVDEFIFLDSVQLTKRSWQTRNKLLINSKETMFSIPIKKTSSRDELLIKDTKISYENFDFRIKLLNLLDNTYYKTSFYNQTNPIIKELILFDTDSLSTYNINIIKNISQKLGINTKFTLLSKSDFNSDSKKGTLILDICKSFYTQTYVSPLGSYEYLQKSRDNFKKSNIEVLYQMYKHPTYEQLSKEFIAYIGIFDLLYNHGFEASLEIIRNGRNYENR